ncbi:PQQ-dependent dehydrogenase, methanol/ethanol family [Derxia lacustris]|uniref:PQQ-dependent dehydrogenase, methanol/ethanol family n=1 Tax=Derxia lacustris TaxID=764842 RepID=UPI000A176F73|nr:PQQ-dependent dehydrogenase, methanol/ethanol family [Derxia lacustris]
MKVTRAITQQSRLQSPRASWRGASLLLALTTALPALAQAQVVGAGADWSTPSGTAQATRYSSLNDITPANAGKLVEEFSFATGVKASHQGQPLVVGSRMYIVTPYPNRLIALDLSNPGVKLWTFSPKVDEFARGVACCDVVNRGAVYADGKVVYNLLDGSTVAVNAITGKQVWRTKLGDPASGETLTGAPIVAKGKVIVGNAGGELGVRGWVQALSLKTGKPVWKAFNTGPDADVLIGADFKAFYAKDRGTDLGATSWPDRMWQQGGSTSWAWFSYDPGLNLVYYGTGNPGVWNPDMRPGDNKWGASIFARNADTGAAVWAYQLTPHDGWDYDAVNESIVADMTIDGRARKVIVHFNKNGFAYTMDRATGEVINANKFGEVTWADHIDLKTGVPAVNPGMATHQGDITQGICPSALGVKDFEPASYSPRTGLFYVPAINLCMNYEPLKTLYIAGTPFWGADLDILPGSGGKMGELIAWDAATGKRAWSVDEPLPLYAGTLATAGDVVFYGTLDRWFKAVNATTGELLFKKQLECGIVGNPISYTGPDGKQRVAVYTGVGWMAGGFAGGTCPAGATASSDAAPMARASARLPIAKASSASTVTSGMLHVFRLP